MVYRWEFVQYMFNYENTVNGWTKSETWRPR